MYNWPLKPFILAHRGARSQKPENTLAAFQKAFELGADGFECDVFLSKDGIPIIMHDETLDRTTQGSGFVWDYSIDALRKLGVPTLEETLHIIPNRGVINIELKGCKPYSPEYLANRVADLIKPHQCKISVILSSFNPQLLKVWHDCPIGLLFEANQAILLPEDLYPDSLNIDHSCLAKALAGFRIILWTAKDLETARSWLSEGVDGVIAEF